MDLGQVFTSEAISDYMVSLFSKKVKRILEPCFGEGAFLKACVKAGYSEIDGCELDKELFMTTKKVFPQLSLYNTDFLGYEPEELYDGIIMNPPYIRQEKIDDLAVFGITKRELHKRELYKHLPATANMYMYFVMKAISLLKHKGELVVIFPSSWMDAQSGASFKKMLMEQTFVEYKVSVSGDVFEENALVEVVILKLFKGRKSGKTKEEVYELIDDKMRKKEKSHEQMTVELTTGFERYANVRRGLSTGWNKMFINPSGVKDKRVLVDILSTPKNVKGYTTDGAYTDKILMIPHGTTLDDNLSQYIEDNKTVLFSQKTPKTLYERACNETEWYSLKTLDSTGILFGYIVRNDMRFVLNTESILARDNFYIIKPKRSRYTVLALLNNYYTYYQLEQMGKKYGAGILKIQRYDVENLKFIDVDCMKEAEQKLLDELGKKLAETSDQKVIQEITKVISPYVNVSYSDIMNAYENIKTHRLEA